MNNYPDDVCEADIDRHFGYDDPSSELDEFMEIIWHYKYALARADKRGLSMRRDEMDGFLNRCLKRRREENK